VKDINECNIAASKCQVGGKEQLTLIHWMFKSIVSYVSPNFTDATILRCNTARSGMSFSNL